MVDSLFYLMTLLVKKTPLLHLQHCFHNYPLAHFGETVLHFEKFGLLAVVAMVSALESQAFDKEKMKLQA